MANTTKITHNSLQVSGLDADWTIPGDLPGFSTSGIRVKSIKFHPGAADDEIVIKAGKGSQKTAAEVIATTATAPEIMRSKSVSDADQRVEYFNQGDNIWPFIDISDCTLSTAGAATIEFQLA